MSDLFISAQTMELKLYSREWCSWCIDAKEYLSERGYNFTEIDVEFLPDELPAILQALPFPMATGETAR